MSQDHAFLPPSSAHRWVHCPLSASLEAAYPEREQSPSAIEGSAAHCVVEAVLHGHPAVGTDVTDEMIEAAELVRNDIVAQLGDDYLRTLVIERRVDIRRVHDTDNWGTPDYYAWGLMVNQGRILRIWDFKFGNGIVEAFENWQMIDYVAGILEAGGIDGLMDQTTVVEFTVIQPRAYHRDGPVRRWRVLASELRPYINKLASAAAKATSGSPPAKPTPDGCKNCKGRHACEALQREGYDAADTSRHLGALELSPAALGLELRTLRTAQALLDARVTGLEAQVVATIGSGTLVPMWSLESSPGRLGWTKPAAEVIALGALMGLDLAKEPEVLTPTQAKKIGLPEALVNSYASRSAGACKLVMDDGSKVARIFNHKEQ